MKNTRQILLNNTFWLSLLELSSKLIMFFVTVALVRYLGVIDFGRLNYAQSFVGVFMLLSDFGLNTILIRDLAKHRHLTSSYVTSTLIFKFVSTIVVLALLTIFGRSDLTLILAMGVFYLTTSLANVFISVLSAYEAMRYVFFSRLIHYLGTLILVSLIIYLRLGLVSVVIAYTSSTLCSLLASLVFLKRLGINWLSPYSAGLTRRLLSDSLPIFGLLAITQLYLNLDTLMLRHVFGWVEVGYYQSAYKILFAFQAINLISTATFPRISSLYHLGRLSQIKRLLQIVIWGTSIIFIPFLILSYYVSPWLITQIYGPSYLPAAQVLPILLFAGVLMFYRNFYSNFFLAASLPSIVFRASLVALIVNLVINYFFIPRYGIVTPGLSLIISELVALGLLSYSHPSLYIRKVLV